MSRWAESLGRDLRFAWQGLRRTPLLTLVAIAMLAIGTGANTAVFSVVDGVLLAASAALTRFMAALLFEIEPLDVPTYAIVAAVLVVVAAGASYLPARRASKVDPSEALAAE